MTFIFKWSRFQWHFVLLGRLVGSSALRVRGKIDYLKRNYETWTVGPVTSSHRTDRKVLKKKYCEMLLWA
jgi:hypothetical protein